MSGRLENLEFLFVTGPNSKDSIFSNLPKFRHLYFKSTSRISEDWIIPQTHSLETLSGVLVCDLDDEKILRCFPHLRHLKCNYDYSWINDCPDLSFLPQLESIRMTFYSLQEDHFPTLERLVLESCNFLKSIPSELGYIPTLQMIEVHSCGKIVRESAMKIKEEQEENGNEELKVIMV
ncbi:NB-ARC domain-containing protein [Abeliophyllum distichum]|uniref:NB-ARC domain-containing protein n=1 Tax=Abeliophyllum distichum TaxID=126358 RepID=A0ABD1SWK6_9LAMI